MTYKYNVELELVNNDSEKTEEVVRKEFYTKIEMEHFLDSFVGFFRRWYMHENVYITNLELIRVGKVTAFAHTLYIKIEEEQV